MQKGTVSSLAEFVGQIEGISGNSRLLLFRGQTLEGNLLPRIARPNPGNDTAQIEQRMLNELRRLGAALLPRDDFDEWDLLVRAQHYGMDTRLLDWTSNPMAALWFACSKEPSVDGYVYALDADGLVQTGSQRSPFKPAKTHVLQPRLNNPRIVAQDGWFTAHRFSKKARRFVRLEVNPEVKDRLTEFRVPCEASATILRSLDRNGISSRTLFPDVEGLCRYLSWRFQDGTSVSKERLP